MIETVLNRYKDEYKNATNLPFKNNTFANYARNEAAEVIRKVINRDDLTVKVSVGQGQWAEVPWIGVFNPEVTEVATNGIYVVYLFSANLEKVYLCQGQGVTRVKEEFGSDQRSELLRRSDLIRTRVPEHSNIFDSGVISLGGSTALAKSYEPAVAYFKEYDLHKLPTEEKLVKDLVEMTILYDRLLIRGGTDNIETFSYFTSDEDDISIEERRRYVRHSRIERNQSAAKAVKKLLGSTCMGCGFNFERIYGERGAGYIEAHHLLPLHLLPSDKAVKMNPKTDFAVLCSNCHRIVHKNKPMLTLQELQNIKGVKMLKKAFSAKKSN